MASATHVALDTATAVLVASDRAELARRVWTGPRTTIFTASEPFCRSLLGYSAEPTLAVLYGAADDLIEFVQFVFANGPNRICLIDTDGSGLARWRRESERSAQFILLDSEPTEYPTVVHDQVVISWNQMARPITTLPDLIRESKFLYVPENAEPHVPVCEIEITDEVSKETLKRLGNDPTLVSWSFDCHSYSPDELLGCIWVLFTKVLALEGLEQMQPPSMGKFAWFLLVTRQCYKRHVWYHSFVHAVDVIQASFMLLLDLGVLETTVNAEIRFRPDNDIGFQPHDALAALVAALGHDMLHPGLANFILIPTTRRYHERWASLEEYHAQFYLNLLRRLWPQVLVGPLEQIITESIWATEMASHMKFMTKSHSRQRTIRHCRILKASDISNSLRDDIHCVVRCAIDVWREYRATVAVAQTLGLTSEISGLDAKIPAVKSLIESQVDFVSHVLLPYFRFMAVSNPVYAPLEGRSQRALSFWEHLRLDPQGFQINIKDPLDDVDTGLDPTNNPTTNTRSGGAGSSGHGRVEPSLKLGLSGASSDHFAKGNIHFPH